MVKGLVCKTSLLRVQIPSPPPKNTHPPCSLWGVGVLRKQGCSLGRWFCFLAGWRFHGGACVTDIEGDGERRQVCFVINAMRDVGVGHVCLRGEDNIIGRDRSCGKRRIVFKEGNDDAPYEITLIYLYGAGCPAVHNGGAAAGFPAGCEDEPAFMMGEHMGLLSDFREDQTVGQNRESREIRFG